MQTLVQVLNDVLNIYTSLSPLHCQKLFEGNDSANKLASKQNSQISSPIDVNKWDF